MTEIALTVEGMTCQHCVRAVTEAIRAQDPGARVQVDLATGRLRAETSLTAEAVAAALAGEGYRVAG